MLSNARPRLFEFITLSFEYCANRKAVTFEILRLTKTRTIMGVLWKH